LTGWATTLTGRRIAGTRCRRRSKKAHDVGLWLLVYAEAGLDAALDLELTAEAQASAYATDFDRVFFLNSMNTVSDMRRC
jgi:hypothetical protein